MSGCLESSKRAESSQFIAPADELKNTSAVSMAPSQGYIERRNIYIKDALSSLGIDAQVVHIAYAEPVAEASILEALANADHTLIIDPEEEEDDEKDEDTFYGTKN